MTFSLDQYTNISHCDFRLTFGLPLEDVFPNGDVHPSLKRLFLAAYRYFLQSNAPKVIEGLVNESDLISYQPKFTALINALTYDKPLPRRLTFEIMVSTLRTYLGALPLPLLPKYTNKEHFNWKKISDECKQIISQRFTDTSRSEVFVEKLARNLLRLPRVNLLLIGYFVNFLRSLVYFGKRGQDYNERSANILINYFSASIFTNRIKSFKDEAQNIYHPLMLFLILKWPQIQEKCHDIQPECFQVRRPVCIRRDFELLNIPNCNATKLSTILEDSELSQTTKESQIVVVPETPEIIRNLSSISSLCTVESKHHSKLSKSTYIKFVRSVQTQVPKLLKKNKEIQTLSTNSNQSKLTSTMSLLKYTQNGQFALPIIPQTNDSLAIDGFSEILTNFSEALWKSEIKSISSRSEVSILDKLNKSNSEKVLNNEQDIKKFESTEMKSISSKSETSILEKFDILNSDSKLRRKRGPSMFENELKSMSARSAANILATFEEHNADTNFSKEKMKERVYACLKKRTSEQASDLETVDKIPSCVNLNDFNDALHYSGNDTTIPLCADKKHKRTILKFPRQMPNAIAWLKQIKNFAAINRARSEELLRHRRYERLPNKKASTI